MIEIWLGMNNFAMAAIAFVLFFGHAAALHWVSFRAPFAAFVRSHSGIVAPFFTSVAVLFSLLLGFLANDVWERNRHGHRAVATEHEALTTLQALGRLTGAHAALDEATRAYAKAAAEREWPAMERQKAAPEAASALDDLLAAAASAGASPAIERAMIDAVQRIRAARGERLLLSLQGPEELRWATVVLLALITQICIAAVHLDKPRPQAAALVLSAVAIWVAISLVAAYEYPFDPPLNVPSTALADVAKAPPAAK